MKRPDIEGLSMKLSVEVDNEAHLVCALNPERSNYIDIVGGGTLNMEYDATNGTRLRGRYTISDGKMKYSLPIIPLHTFNIKEGSYVEFMGRPNQHHCLALQPPKMCVPTFLMDQATDEW